jgi:hypothetical protein|tara:strand:+ start:5060 stop:5491 length:432 start_codon:yes stop_codon:yes gene_type:complete
MKILTTSTSAQTITFAPRTYPSTVIVSIRDTSTNTTTRTESVSLTRTNDKASISTTFNLKEGRFYDLKILQGVGALWNTYNVIWEAATNNWENIVTTEKDIYLDKVFCTDQTINQIDNDYYTINSGEYTETTNYPNDDYIIID